MIKRFLLLSTLSTAAVVQAQQTVIVSNFTATPKLFHTGNDRNSGAIFQCAVNGDRCTILGQYENRTTLGASGITTQITDGTVWSSLDSTTAALILAFCTNDDTADCQAECTSGCRCTLLSSGMPCDEATVPPSTSPPNPVQGVSTPPPGVTCGNRVIPDYSSTAISKEPGSRFLQNQGQDDVAICEFLMGGENNTVQASGDCACFNFCNDQFIVCDRSAENNEANSFTCPEWVPPAATDYLANKTPPVYPGKVTGCARQDRINAGYDYSLASNASNFLPDDNGSTPLEEALNSTHGTGNNNNGAGTASTSSSNSITSYVSFKFIMTTILTAVAAVCL